MVVKVKLSPDGIKEAQKQIELFKTSLAEKTELFVKKLAELGLAYAQEGFRKAEYAGDNDVIVVMSVDGKKATIVASGKAVAFIEFGTGVSYAEHPSGMYKHGTYGKGQGNNSAGWVYRGVPGTLGVSEKGRKRKNGKRRLPRPGVYHTKGNPPAMAMWGAIEEIATKVHQVWEDVMHG